MVAKRRSIVFSTEAFKHDRLVDVFVNAVFCSLDGYYCQPKSIINVEVGTNVDVDVAIGLTEKHYEWESLHTV